MIYLTKKECEEIAKNLGQEKRQEVLNFIKKGNALGEVAIKFNLDLLVVCEILTQNITEMEFINYKAI